MSAGKEEVSQILLAQRIRNRIIEYLETASSFEEQLAYQANVPIAHVPAEMIVQWEDWVRDPNDAFFAEPVFPEPNRWRLRNSTAFGILSPKTPLILYRSFRSCWKWSLGSAFKRRRRARWKSFGVAENLMTSKKHSRGIGSDGLLEGKSNAI